MREELEVIDGQRMSFTGTISRYGGKGGGKYTILMTDVRHLDGRMATDHVWFNLTLGFKSLRLEPGERVRFDARVKPYTKGYKGTRKAIVKPVKDDYKLSHPTKISRVAETADSSTLNIKPAARR